MPASLAHQNSSLFLSDAIRPLSSSIPPITHPPFLLLNPLTLTAKKSNKITKLLHFRQKSSTFVALFCGYAAMPQIENFCGGVRVTIEWTVFMKLSHVGSSVGSDVTSSVTSLSSVKLPKKQMAILELIRKDSRISVKEMSLVLSQVERTIKRQLADLQKKGILIREGNTSAGHWEIIEK